MLFRCSQEESQLIREAARHEHRDISSYIMNAIMQRIKNKERVLENLPDRLKRKLVE